MAKSLNKVMLIGNLGGDPELRYTSSGVAVANFNIATSMKWTDPDGNAQEKTEWHTIVAWRKLAEICGEYLKKGRRVYIEGRLQTRSWDDKNGVKHWKTEIIADDMIMLDGRAETAGEPLSPTAEEQGPAEKEEDLPF
jgi:single-strand DNA-binding protein